MTITTFGRVLSPDGIGAWYGEYGTLLEATTIESIDGDLGVIPVDLDHDRRYCGEVVHAEYSPDGALHAVAVLDADHLLDHPRPLHYSGKFTGRTTDPEGARCSTIRDATLEALAIGENPAGHGLPPITILPGDIRSTVARYTWPTSTLSDHPILARALTDLEHRNGDRLRHILDRRTTTRPATAAAPATAGSWSSIDCQPRATIEHRSAGPVMDVRFAERIIELVAVPYDEDAHIQVGGRWIVESVAPGSFTGVEHRARRIKVNRDHDITRTVGRCLALHPSRSEGLVAELLIGRSPLGDETLEYAADGILDASVGFAPFPGGETYLENRSRRRITRAFLGHIALVPESAYIAPVLAVR